MMEHLDETGGLGHLDNADGVVDLADLGLPQGIRELIHRSLGRLSPTTHRLLTLAAVIGREFRLSVVETLVDLGEDAVLDAMDEALAARIITEEPGTPGNFSFTPQADSRNALQRYHGGSPRAASSSHRLCTRAAVVGDRVSARGDGVPLRPGSHL